MELSRQMLLLTAENYGSYYLHITYRGVISDAEMMELIINTVKESPTISKKQLREFGII